MTMYAEVEELQERFPRDLTTSEVERAPILLEDASFWLGVWVPGLVDAVDSNAQLETAAKLLVIAMVRRTLLAGVPESPGVSSQMNVAGPYTQQVSYRNPEGNLYLYARELSDITSLLQDNRAGAVSMRSPGL